MHQSTNVTLADGEINDLPGQSPVMHDAFPSLEALDGITKVGISGTKAGPPIIAAMDEG